MSQDDVEALWWFILGGARSSRATAWPDVPREWSVEFLDDLEGRMTPEQIAEAERRAREWTPTPEPET